MTIHRIAAAAFLACLAGASFSQPATNAPARRGNPPVYSPEVQPDRSVVFRIRAPKANEVKASGEWGGAAVVLAKDAEGVWSGTAGPLAPELYGYSFEVDGLRVPDPGNPSVKPMRSPTTSVLEISGTPPLLHELRDVPHGAVAIHSYYSEALSLWRRAHVYTPPGYARGTDSYPVLYLCHGAGDNDATWSSLGRAGVILDNLLAEQKVRPMIVVMPDGHPLAGRITGVPGPDMMRKNVEAFTEDILKEVIPLVEREYRTLNQRQSRAVAGLSMGGGHAVDLGLNHPELFNYVGAFSAFVADSGSARFKFFEAADKPALIWTACGKDDFLLDNAKQLSENFKKNSVRHELLITEGNHSWPVWRKYLAQFAPLLFTP